MCSLSIAPAPRGMLPCPSEGQSWCLCLALCVQQSSSSVGVNPREQLDYTDSSSGFSEQAGLKGLVVS